MLRDTDGAPVEDWRCQGCGRLILVMFLHVLQGEVIFEHKCRCKTINLLTRIAGPCLPTNGQGRLGRSRNDRANEPSTVQGGRHAESPIRHAG